MRNTLSLDTLDKLVTVIGIALIGYGLYLIHPPSCWIVVGSILSFPSLPRKGVD